MKVPEPTALLRPAEPVVVGASLGARSLDRWWAGRPVGRPSLPPGPLPGPPASTRQPVGDCQVKDHPKALTPDPAASPGPRDHPELPRIFRTQSPMMLRGTVP